MEVLLYVVIAVVALWALGKIFGLLADLTTSSSRKRARESAAGLAIQRAVATTGRFDGSREAKRRARDAFIGLASDGPYSMRLPSGVTLEDIADDFAEGRGADGQPILLEAAYLVVGGHRVAFPTDPQSSSPEQRREEQNDVFLLVSLFPEWAKTRQVGGPGALREQSIRFAMVLDLLLDMCERDGLLVGGDQ